METKFYYDCPFCNDKTNTLDFYKHIYNNHEVEAINKYIEYVKIIRLAGGHENNYKNNAYGFSFLDMLVHSPSDFFQYVLIKRGVYKTTEIIDKMVYLLTLDTKQLKSSLEDIINFGYEKGLDASNMLFPILNNVLGMHK